VLFDLGYTLVHPHHEETLQKILEAHGIVRSIDEIRQAQLKGSKEFNIEKHSGLPAHEFYTKWNLVELKHLRINDRAKAKTLAEEIDYQWFEYAEIHVYPDVKETLQKLKQMGLKLGVITGGYEEDIAKILPKAELKEFFDVCVGVNTTGKRKPHPKTFKYALKQLGIKPHEAIFVGDSPEADYMGAERVGLIPVLIKREGSPTLNVRCIKRLSEIFKVLEQINP